MYKFFATTTFTLLSRDAVAASLPSCHPSGAYIPPSEISLLAPGLAGAARINLVLPMNLDIEVRLFSERSHDNCASMVLEAYEKGWSVGSLDVDNGNLSVPLTFNCSDARASISSSVRPSALLTIAAAIAATGMAVGNPYAGGLIAATLGVLALAPSSNAQDATNICTCTPSLNVRLLVPDPSTITTHETTREFECHNGNCGFDASCPFNVTHTVVAIVEGRPFTMPSGPALLARETCSNPDAQDWVDNISLASIGANITNPIAAARWYNSALAEHASVASFSRSSLELMAVGAPMSLVEATHLAALDEMRHARTAFGLARFFGHHAAGPGAFPLPNLLEVSSTFQEIAVKTFREGCVSEMVAVARAHLELSREMDVLVKAALGAVVADEARHAALAWRIVAWASQHDGNVSRSLLAERTFIEAKASCREFEEPMAMLECYVLRILVLPWLDALLTTGKLSELWPYSLAAASKDQVSLENHVVASVLNTSKIIAKEFNFESARTIV